VTGVYQSPLGTINLTDNSFDPNEILGDNGFQPVQPSDVARFEGHNKLLNSYDKIFGYGLLGGGAVAGGWAVKNYLQQPPETPQWNQPDDDDDDQDQNW
jgi:hypothetical protein